MITQCYLESGQMQHKLYLGLHVLSKVQIRTHTLSVRHQIASPQSRLANCEGVGSNSRWYSTQKVIEFVLYYESVILNITYVGHGSCAN